MSDSPWKLLKLEFLFWLEKSRLFKEKSEQEEEPK
jgi:hypothetical protein